MKTVIINYGLGNLRSVANAVHAVGHEAIIATAPSQLDEGDRFILPGVGAFADGMRGLRDGGWIEPLERRVKRGGQRLLGLCLGMQLLATTGTEHETLDGLGWIDGVVERLPSTPDLRVPHIGWNDVRFTRSSALFDGAAGAAFYFVHSYVLQPVDRAIVTGVTDYGGEFVSTIECGNIYATQFHPEKSQHAGLAMLKRFMDLPA